MVGGWHGKGGRKRNLEVVRGLRDAETAKNLELAKRNAGLVSEKKSKEKLSKDMFRVIQRIIPKFTKERMEKASVLQLAQAVGVLIEKHRLLNDESTTNISVCHSRREMLRELGLGEDGKMLSGEELMKVEVEGIKKGVVNEVQQAKGEGFEGVGDRSQEAEEDGKHIMSSMWNPDRDSWCDVEEEQ